MKRLGSLITAILFLAMIGLANATPPQAPANAPPGQGNWQASNGHFSAGGYSSVGSIAVAPLGTQSAPTVVATCDGTCATTYTYYCVGEDINAVSATGVGETAPSASGTTTVQAATLTATRFNTITCAGDKSVISFLILKADTSHILGRCYTASGQCSLVDNSTAAGSAYTANGSDKSGSIVGTVSGGSTKIAGGTSALATAAVLKQTCATTVTTSATGVAATDAISWSHNAAVTGSTNGQLIIHAFPTTNNVNFQECNPSAADITPPADTLNWTVMR